MLTLRCLPQARSVFAVNNRATVKTHLTYFLNGPTSLQLPWSQVGYTNRSSSNKGCREKGNNVGILPSFFPGSSGAHSDRPTTSIATKTMASYTVDLSCLEGKSFIIKTPQNNSCKCFKFRQAESSDRNSDFANGSKSKGGQSVSKELDGAAALQKAGSSNSSSIFESKKDLRFFSAFSDFSPGDLSAVFRADQAIQKELSSFLTENELFRCYVHDSGVFKLKGFFFPDETGEKGQKLSEIQEKFAKLYFKMRRLGDAGRSYELQDPEDASKKWFLEASDDTKPEYHPLYMNVRTEAYNSVYHSYEDAIRILNQNLDIPEVVELLDIAKDYIDPGLSVSDLQSQIKHPFIVIEGLDATGKSTLSKNLSELLGACHMKTPSDPIYHLRRTFDELPEMIRRSYFYLGNYIVANEVAEKCRKMPVIMDRYWHSTTAYAIANDCDYDDLNNLPPPGHWVYQWPHDLMKPTQVLFLTVSEEIRAERMRIRNETLSWEEEKLGAKASFRKKLLEAYRRMVDPPCVEIDASVSREMVAERAKEALKEVGALPS